MCGTCTLTCNCCQATLCNDHLYFMKLLTMPQDGCLLSPPALPAITASSEACKEPSLTQKCKQKAVVYGQPSKHYLHALLPTISWTQSWCVVAGDHKREKVVESFPVGYQTGLWTSLVQILALLVHQS